jgi:outer membrane protein TolC
VVRLSLAEAVSRARETAPRLAQLRAAEQSAEASARGARAERLPRLDLLASYFRTSEVPELSQFVQGQGVITIFPNIQDNYRTRLDLTLPLYTGGRVKADIAAARARQEAAAHDLAAGGGDVVLETTRAYWELVTSRENARVLAEGITAYDAHVTDARNRLEQGLAARNEVLAVQVERDRAELARLQAESAAAVANEDLVRLTGLAAGTRIEAADSASIPGQAPAGDREALVREALEARGELRALRARVASAESAVKIARAAGLPQAALAGGYEYSNPNTRILPPTSDWKGTWSVGVSLNWAVFDGGRVSAAAAQATAEAERVRRELQDAEQRVRLEATARALELETAGQAVGVAERNLEAAHENRRVAEDRQREGLISSADRLDAETALLQAGLDRISALAQVRVAQASLDRALGR